MMTDPKPYTPHNAAVAEPAVAGGNTDGAVSGGKHFAINAAVSVFLFLLFREWLQPFASMAELTDIHRLNPFIWAIGTYLLVDALRIPGWIGWPLKAVFTVAWIGYWFAPEALASGAWWWQAAMIAASDYERMLNNDWFSLSPELRTFFFLLGWSALVYAVYRIIMDRGQGLWFVGATIGFLLLLQLWPGVDTNAGLIRSAVWGLSMLAVLNIPRWEHASGFSAIRGRRSIALGTLAGVILGSLALGLGYALSAPLSKDVEPVSLDPMLMWTSRSGAAEWAASIISNASTVSTSAKTGYGNYDGNLGGPVSLDESVAFIARSPLPAYWRGESKDIYTGRGWRKSALSDTSSVFRSMKPPEEGLASGAGAAGAVADAVAGAGADAGAAATIEQEVRIVDEGLSQLVFTGGPVLRFREITSVDGSSLSDIHIRHNAGTGAYYVGTGEVKLSSYTIEAAVGVRSEELLLLSGAGDTILAEDLAVPVPEDISRRNLQLPERLPDRVKELAEQIVQHVPDNRLLEVLAVQRYLQENYQYTLDTKMPPQGADFVDHFLFEQMEGYCNHFSTAMVVLLRSIGIESRWVKGFAPGTPESSGDVGPGASADPATYVIKGSDAHSWVEVYFPGAGWVPFEATPGFGSVGSVGGSSNSDSAVPAANMMLPDSELLRGSGVNAEIALASVSDSNEGEQLAFGDRALRLLAGMGQVQEAARSSAVTALQQLREGYDRAAAIDRRLPGALLGLTGVILLAAAALALNRFAAESRRRHRARGTTMIRNAASAAALARLDRFWSRLYRRYGARPSSYTLREYVRSLPPRSREALDELLRYDETVRFGGDTGRRATRQWLDGVWRKLSG